MKRLGIILSILSVASISYGVSLVTKPYTFTDGSKAEAGKVNADFDTAYTGINAAIGAINTAAGTRPTLDSRLNVSINPDGTMRSAITAGGEWVNPAFSKYSSSTTSRFKILGDQTSIYLAKRRIKASLSASKVYSEVTSSTYSAGTGYTTINIADPVLVGAIYGVEHSELTPYSATSVLSDNMLNSATANTASTLVRRDSSGNFSAGTITASLIGNVTGNASTATNVAYSGLTGTVPTWNQNTTGNAATATNADQLDNQHGSYYQPASTAITTSNIASQSVANATYATYLNNQPGSYYQPVATAITTSNIAAQSVANANNANVAKNLTGEFRIPWSARSSYRGARVGKSGHISIATAAATFLPFDTEIHDTDTMHELVSNNTRLTVPNGVTKVRLNGHINWSSGNAVGRRVSTVYKNNAIVTTLSFVAQPVTSGSSTGSATNCISSGVLDVVGGDYFEIRVYQDSGVDTVMVLSESWFEMEIIE